MATMKMSVLLAGVALVAIASPAFAQTETAAGGQQATEAGYGAGDIVVTAQRREERGQDVPVVVTAFSSERLDQLDVNEPQDLYGTVPSLVVGNQGGASREAQNFSIRGQATGYLSSPAVAVYLNEVPLAANAALGLQGSPGLIVDLESVQVLSGPQGTLFGRNTTGGAVLYTPRKPKDNFEGYVEGSIGNYDFRGIEGAINIPVIEDKLLVRAVGAFQDRRGYTKDLVWDKWRDDTHWYSGRIGIVMRPTERLENYLLLFGADSSTNGAGHIHRSFNIAGLKGVNFCYEGPSVPFAIASCDVYRRQTEIADEIGPRRTRMSVDEFSKIKTWGAINTTTLELSDQLTFKNIFGYQRQKVDYGNDQDATPLQQYEYNQTAPNPGQPVPGLTDEFGLPRLGYLNALTELGSRNGLKQITEEAQIQGNMLDNKLIFTTGLFYFISKPVGPDTNASIVYCPAEFTGLCPYTVSSARVTNKSTALYAQATLDLGAFTPSLDRLRLTGGFRYTWDDIKGSTNRAFLSSARLKSKAPTWTIGLDYKPVEDVLVYAKVSRGYKSGGFNPGAVRETSLTFQPEKLTTYEAGFKSDWRLGTMPFRLNATYYYSDYSNIQRPGGEFNPDNSLSGAVVLAAQARIQGIEVETSIRPARGVEIGGSFSYTDPKYKKFDFNVPANGGPFEGCDGLVAPGGVADVSCFPFQFVTKYLYNIYGSLDLPIPAGMGEASLYVNYSHVSSQPTAPFGNSITEPGSILEPHGLFNASLSWRNIGETGLDATLFANNVTNKLYRVSNSNVFNGLLVQSELYGEPRTYGLKLRYRFGSQ